MARFKTIYKTVGDYLPNAKRNDILVFSGFGLLTGFDRILKHNTCKLIEANKNQLRVRPYRAKNLSRLPDCAYNQRVAVLSKKEFKDLKETLEHVYVCSFEGCNTVFDPLPTDGICPECETPYGHNVG